MRNFFTAVFVLLALFTGITGATLTAHAAIGDSCSEENDSACDPATSYCELIQNSPQYNTCVSNSRMAADATNAQTAADIAAAGTPKNPELGSDAGSQYGQLMIWIMSLFAWLVGVAAITLDYAVYYTVVKMGSYVSNLSAVGVAWRIMRDMANIALIFGFLAIGINIILDTDFYGWGKGLLPKLLMAAVFLNFSLFISEAVIDTGNLFATQFYTQINGGIAPTALSMASLSTKNEGISNKIMAQLGLQTIYGNGTVRTEIFQNGSPWYIGFMGILLFITTAFVMFTLAFILIARFVALIFIIILAPIGFVGFAIPKLKDKSEWWIETLFQQTITAPVLLFFLYIALAVITDAKFLTGFGATNTSASAATGFIGNANLPGFASFILSFLVAMGMLLLVARYAKRLSAVGASWATSTAGKLSYGAVAFAGRRTVGRASNYAARSIRSGAWGEKLQASETGRLFAGIADRGAKASYDVRGIKSITGALKEHDILLGEAQKGGYGAILKKGTESRTKYAADLKGRELNKDEQLEKLTLEKLIADNKKALGVLAVKRKTSTGAEAEILDKNIEKMKEAIGKREKELEDLESETDVGAKRQYAKNLFFGKDENSFFNKYVVSGVYTEAAKKIKKEAKKSKADADLDILKKALEKAGKGDSGGEEKKEEKPPAS